MLTSAIFIIQVSGAKAACEVQKKNCLNNNASPLTPLFFLTWVVCIKVKVMLFDNVGGEGTVEEKYQEANRTKSD